MSTDQNASAPLILGLPRLRPDFLPAQVMGLWPGLPHMPKGCWQPAYAWSPDQARACLADHEAAPDLPAQSWLAESLQASAGNDLLRPDEESALASFAHDAGLADAAKTDSADAAAQKPEAAQSALIMAWLQEGRVLDMAKLRHKLAVAEAKQKALFTGEEPAPELDKAPSLSPDETALLPPWAYVLRAASLFLPEHCELYCADATLAQVLKQGAALGPSPIPGCLIWRAPLPGQAHSPVRLWHIPSETENLQ